MGAPIDRAITCCLEWEETWLERRPCAVDGRIRVRLSDLSDRRDGAFSAGDPMTVEALRRLDGSGLLEDCSNLPAYGARAEARPAFKRAFAAQSAVFTAASTG